MSKRHFLALVPTGLADQPEVERLLTKLKRTLRERETDVKWVRPDLWHTTVRFFGTTDVQSVCSKLEGWRCPKGLTLRISGLGAFPEVLAARVLWLGVQASQELVKLHHDLGARLGLGPDPEGFVPHVTVARLRHTGAVGDLVGLAGRKHFGDYPVDRVVLFESEGMGHQVRYTRLAEISESGLVRLK